MKCNICNKDKNEFLFAKNNYNYFKCINCGFIFLNPLPTENALKEEYDINYLTKYKDQYFSNIKENIKAWEPWVNKIPFKKNSSLLDIGCSTGFFLKAAQNRGFKVTGIEFSKKAIDFAKKKLNLNILEGHFLDVKIKDSFDIITMFNLIEHVKDPKETLLKANTLLKNNGLLILTTINFKSLNSILFKKNWLYYDPPEHLYHFSPKLIKTLLNKTGFKVVKLKTHFTFSALGHGIKKTKKNIIYSLLNKPFRLFVNTLKLGDILEVHAIKCQ